MTLDKQIREPDLAAVLLCGGRGRRLGALTNVTPKPLLTIHGTTILSRVLAQIDRLGVERVLIVVDFQREKIWEAARAHTWTAAPPKLVFIDQELPNSEGALLSGLRAAATERVLVRCGDDLIDDALTVKLARAEAPIAVMTRLVVRTPLRRLLVRDDRVIGTTQDQGAPIMTYNLSGASGTLREWAEGAVGRNQPLVNLLDGFAGMGIQAVNGDESFGVNTVAQLRLARSHWQD